MTNSPVSLRELLSFPNSRVFAKAEKCEVIYNNEHYDAHVVATGSYDANDDHAQDYFIVVWHDSDGLVCAKTTERRYLKHIEAGLLHFKELPEELQEKISSSRKLCRRSELGRDYRTVLPRQVITVVDPASMTEFGMVVDTALHEIDPYDDCHTAVFLGRECDCNEKIAVVVYFVLDDKQEEELVRKGYKFVFCEPHHIS